MADTTAIREHMEVVGSDGQHVGTVDHVNGDQIKLTRKDPAAGGEHHLIPTSLVASVDVQVRLSQPAEQVRGSWHAA
ncbi:hypothetical protein tb265_22100 [Gemmatimonadetes bacterium T265]|nr:hypothetical protein tb265_22100 [Gemmatimonadetes bacterium T265]